MLKRSWCEIDLNRLKENYIICKRKLKNSCDITAVVKADAYGHGAKEVALALQKVGCKNFAVATVSEGGVLRKRGVAGKILILGYTPPQMLKNVFKEKLCQTVFSKEYADLVCKERLPLEIQIAVDTGMNRIGFKWENDSEIIETIENLSKNHSIGGLFTHFACADDDYSEFTEKQKERFLWLTEKLKNKIKDCWHFSNSDYFLKDKGDFLNFVRLGICLYGLGDNLLFGIKPVMKWKSVVVMVKTIKAGEGVGYGQTFISTSDRVIATVATGYADGFSFALSNNGKVEIRGKFAKIVGRICMDMFMVDATEILDVSVGDEVVLIGEKYGANDMAKDAKTIPYEVVCSISKRVPRIYLGE